MKPVHVHVQIHKLTNAEGYFLGKILITSPWVGVELTMLVVIGTDCIDSWKSNYHTIMTMMAPKQLLIW
jgi:hypothetical protein